jgi:hypothetical protein
VKCNICGAETERTDDHRVGAGWHLSIDRRCTNGHALRTHEVYTNMLADAREMNSALGHTARRVERWARDQRIARDERPSKEVAAEYGLTEARVRQIRAALTRRPPASPWQQLFNLERKEA